jgi:hypothetical protein
VGVVAVVNGAGCPGATTSTVALACCWPARVVLADCDPGGGAIAWGRCHRQFRAGDLDLDVGVGSLVEATRLGPSAMDTDLAAHLQTAQHAPNVDLLVGVRSWREGLQVGQRGWHRVAAALVHAGRRQSSRQAGCDVLVDCGRLGTLTPWPVLESADLVLAACRPGRRHVVWACEAVEVLAARIPPRRLAILACASSPAGADRLLEASRVLPAVELPDDRAAAERLLAGRGWRRFERSRLGRASRRGARRLHRRLRTRYPEGQPPLGAAGCGGAA